jgi:hypothetical protein
MDQTAGPRFGGGWRVLDAFRDPVVLPVDGSLRLAGVRAVVRTLSEAVGMSPPGVRRLVAGASKLAGSLFHGSSREGRILLRLLKDGDAVGMEIALECEEGALGRGTPLIEMKRLMDECEVVAVSGGGSRVVARKWEAGPSGRA